MWWIGLKEFAARILKKYRSADLRDGGYLDFAKDPDRAAKVEALFAQDEMDVVSLMQQPPSVLVGLLASDCTRRSVVQALQFSGRDAFSALAAALTDPKYQTLYTDGQRQAMGMYGTATPVEVVLDCLVRIPDPRLVPTVAPLIESQNKSIRESAAELLGAIGTDECISALARALTDTDKDVAGSAIRGLLSSLRRGDTSALFKSTVYEYLLPLVCKPSLGLGRNSPAAECLIQIDHQHASLDLCRDDYLSMRNPAVYKLISTLRRAQVQLPESRLLRILQDAEVEPAKHPHAYVIGEILEALAQQRSSHAEIALARNRQSTSAEVRIAALHATCALRGSPSPYSAAFQRINTDDDIDAAPEPIRTVILCRFLIDQVNNGGFSQYFVNGYGRRWKDTLLSLHTIGAHRAVELLRAVVELFGSDGPDLGHYDRDVASLHNRMDKPGDIESTEFYEHVDSIEERLLVYILAHIDNFKT